MGADGMTQAEAVRRAWRAAALAENLMENGAIESIGDRVAGWSAVAGAWAATAGQLEFVIVAEAPPARCPTCGAERFPVASSIFDPPPEPCIDRWHMAGRQSAGDTQVIRINLDHEFVPAEPDDGHCDVLVGGMLCGYLRAAHVTPGQGASPSKWCNCEAYEHGHLRSRHCT